MSFGSAYGSPPVQSVACGGDFQPAHKPAARCSQPFQRSLGSFSAARFGFRTLLTPPWQIPCGSDFGTPSSAQSDRFGPAVPPTDPNSDGSDLALQLLRYIIGLATRKRCGAARSFARTAAIGSHQATRTLVPPGLGLPVNPSRPRHQRHAVVEPRTTRTSVPHATSGSSSVRRKVTPLITNDSADLDTRCPPSMTNNNRLLRQEVTCGAAGRLRGSSATESPSEELSTAILRTLEPC